MSVIFILHKSIRNFRVQRHIRTVPRPGNKLLQLLVHPIHDNHVIKLALVLVFLREKYNPLAIFLGFARNPHEISRILIDIITCRAIQQHIILLLEQVKYPAIRRTLVDRHQSIALRFRVNTQYLHLVLLEQLYCHLVIRGGNFYKLLSFCPRTIRVLHVRRINRRRNLDLQYIPMPLHILVEIHLRQIHHIHNRLRLRKSVLLLPEESLYRISHRTVPHVFLGNHQNLINLARNRRHQILRGILTRTQHQNHRENK